ncbi:hypothetical protein [Pseudidiomarina insulisalsae]|uniref:Uncharacterized protein n=1 Tax=Pseudidiomarina insulisalsae TaxID=575789 RepID=A0A432YQX2_9GAMM|nr:hypothetical protein [Pseudidiomarina insulisalsae]RUO63676.1 hypothetical protein CWI71_01025 [Pseudidiomarina insulisalsae]
MLYAINDRVNRAIHELLDGAAVAVVYPEGNKKFAISVPFVQCKELSHGLLITRGFDEYLPSSTLHLIEGEIQIDSGKGTIVVVKDGQLMAEIRKADREDASALRSCMERLTQQDRSRRKTHIEFFIAQAEDSEKFWDIDEN